MAPGPAHFHLTLVCHWASLSLCVLAWKTGLVMSQGRFGDERAVLSTVPAPGKSSETDTVTGHLPTVWGPLTVLSAALLQFLVPTALTAAAPSAPLLGFGSLGYGPSSGPALSRIEQDPRVHWARVGESGRIPLPGTQREALSRWLPQSSSNGQRRVPVAPSCSVSGLH